MAEGFERPPDVVDQPGARSDEGEVGLGVLPPMGHRVQKLGVAPEQAGQLLGVYPVALAGSSVDQARLPGVRHHDPVAALRRQPTHPRRVRADLDGYGKPLHALEASLEGFGGGPQPALLDDLARVGVEQADVGAPVAEFHPHRRPRPLLASRS